LTTGCLPTLTRDYHHRVGKEWFERGIRQSDVAQQYCVEAGRVRSNTTIVRSQVGANDKVQVQKVNMHLRNKMNKTGEMIRGLEAGMKSSSIETGCLGEVRRVVARAREDLQSPLAACLARLQLRDQRPPRERIEDPLHMALEIQRNDLTNLHNQLNAMQDALSEMSSRLVLVRQRLSEDATDKKRAYQLDNTCLNLTHERAPLHPPKQDTIHVKASIMFGDVPPSAPTAILMGENAGGRFNYEWLFTKEERDAIRASFESLAENNTIPNTLFEVILKASRIGLDEAHTAALLDMLRLHPEDSMSWELVVQSLATCRGETEHAVQLPNAWRAKTKRDLDTNHALLMAAGRLRYQASELVAFANETKNKDNAFTQKQLRKKIQETSELKGLCEKRIMEANLEIRKLEESESALCREFEARSRPLAVSESRYNIRRRRGVREDIHDAVEDALQVEVAELQTGVTAIQKEMDLTRHTLDAMKENRHALEEDFADKHYSLELHMKCLKMDVKTFSPKLSS